MTPYYEQDGITIYHGDCRDVLPGMSDVGLVLTSPPYNLRGDGYKQHGNTWRSLDTGYADHEDDMPHDEYVAWQQSILSLCWASLAEDGAIFYNHKPIVRGNKVKLPFELVPQEATLRQVVTWDRTIGFMRVANYFVPSFEWVLILARDSFRLTTLRVFDLWRIPVEGGKGHPAAFPLRLATTAIGATSAATVVDPFMGSGTTLVAAKQLGRRAVGIEISESYCEVAAARLAQGVLSIETSP